MRGAEQHQLSVISLVWRNQGYLRDFVVSLDRSFGEAGTRGRLILVENGTDGKVDHDGLRVVRNTDIKIIRSATNLGFAGGMNLGVAHAMPTEIFVLANLDLRWHTDFAARIKDRIPGAGHRWDSLTPSVRRLRDEVELGGPMRRGARNTLVPAPPGSRITGGHGCCMILHRAVVERRLACCGSLFDDEYHSFGEDQDLFWWASRHGIRVVHDPTLLIFHAVAGSFGGRQSFSERPSDIREQVAANYRLNNFKYCDSFIDWVRFGLGEATLAIRFVSVPGGVGSYVRSWRRTVTSSRAIRDRRGGLRC